MNYMHVDWAKEEEKIQKLLPKNQLGMAKMKKFYKEAKISSIKSSFNSAKLNLNYGYFEMSLYVYFGNF